MGKVKYLFFRSVLLLLTKSLFWKLGWAVGYNSITFSSISQNSTVIFLIVPIFLSLTSRCGYSIQKKLVRLQNCSVSFYFRFSRIDLSHVSLSKYRCQDPRYASVSLLLLIDQYAGWLLISAT